MSQVHLNGKTFVPYITYEEISKDIDAVAARLNADYGASSEEGDVPIIVTVLNGAMIFTAELMERLSFDCELMSVKVKSYAGTSSTGEVKMPMGLTGSVQGRRVIIVEDIIDTGNTIVFLKDLLCKEGAADVKICAMLLKPEVYTKDIKPDYIAREIPNKFIVGFGLDYDELGRNYKDIYVLDESAEQQ